MNNSTLSVLGGLTLLAFLSAAIAEETVDEQTAPSSAEQNVSPALTPTPLLSSSSSAPPRSSTRQARAQAASPSQLDLNSSVVTGNRELPKVMSIVPWKKAQPGAIAGRPSNSLLNEILTPVDREVFRRQLRYYDGIQQAELEQSEANREQANPELSSQEEAGSEQVNPERANPEQANQQQSTPRRDQQRDLATGASEIN